MIACHNFSERASTYSAALGAPQHPLTAVPKISGLSRLL
jgi:hypothetical protein